MPAPGILLEDELRLTRQDAQQVVRIDTHLNRWLRKNGLERGCLSIAVPGSILTAVQTESGLIDAWPPFRGLLADRAAAPEGEFLFRGEQAEVPVNLGQLVIGDHQHLVALPDPSRQEDAGTLRICMRFAKSDTILKLTECRVHSPGQIVAITPLVEHELNDPGVHGMVTVICPENEVGLLLLPDEPLRRRELVSWVMGTIPDHDPHGLALASLRAALFGQWITLEYRDNRLLPPEGYTPALVQWDAAPGRRDLYMLQWNRRPVRDAAAP